MRTTLERGGPFCPALAQQQPGTSNVLRSRRAGTREMWHATFSRRRFSLAIESTHRQNITQGLKWLSRRAKPWICPVARSTGGGGMQSGTAETATEAAELNTKVPPRLLTLWIPRQERNETASGPPTTLHPVFYRQRTASPAPASRNETHLHPLWAEAGPQLLLLPLFGPCILGRATLHRADLRTLVLVRNSHLSTKHGHEIRPEKSTPPSNYCERGHQDLMLLCRGRSCP